jgi:hypothetical protein
MIIPELTESQVKLLYDVSNISEMRVFSQSSPIPTDPLQESLEALQGAKDVEYLISLGLIKNISESNAEGLEKLLKETGRVCQVFEVLPYTMKMFHLPASPEIN